MNIIISTCVEFTHLCTSSLIVLSLFLPNHIFSPIGGSISCNLSFIQSDLQLAFHFHYSHRWSNLKSLGDQLSPSQFPVISQSSPSHLTVTDLLRCLRMSEDVWELLRTIEEVWGKQIISMDIWECLRTSRLSNVICRYLRLTEIVNLAEIAEMTMTMTQVINFFIFFE